MEMIYIQMIFGLMPYATLFAMACVLVMHRREIDALKTRMERRETDALAEALIAEVLKEEEGK
jgi:hypothetical protein